MHSIRNQILAVIALALPLFGADAKASPCTSPASRMNLTAPIPDLSAPRVAGPVTVRFALENGLLTAQFNVDADEIHASPVLPPGVNVYDQDVVEVFLSVMGDVSQNGTYFEFELSPYGNTLQVRIDVRKGKKSFTDGVQLGMTQTVTIRPDGSGWDAEMTIPLANLQSRNRALDLHGGAFAILGEGHSKKFYSLNLPPQKKARFHLPEKFAPLISCRR